MHLDFEKGLKGWEHSEESKWVGRFVAEVPGSLEKKALKVRPSIPCSCSPYLLLLLLKLSMVLHSSSAQQAVQPGVPVCDLRGPNGSAWFSACNPHGARGADHLLALAMACGLAWLPPGIARMGGGRCIKQQSGFAS